MTHRPDLRRDLEPDTPEELLCLAQTLQTRRPVPVTAFRGALRRRLLSLPHPVPRPPRLGTLMTAYALAGAVLLMVGVLSVLGIGPLGA